MTEANIWRDSGAQAELEKLHAIGGNLPVVHIQQSAGHVVRMGLLEERAADVKTAAAALILRWEQYLSDLARVRSEIAAEQAQFAAHRDRIKALSAEAERMETFHKTKNVDAKTEGDGTQ